MDLGAGLIAILTGVLVKGAVMVIAVVLVVRLFRSSWPGAKPWRLVPVAERGRVRLLWAGLVAFAVSELTCGIEVYVLTRSSTLLEGLHGVVSAAGMALFGVGLYEVLDARVVRFGRPGCAARGVCGRCTVREEEGCRLRPLSMILGALLAVACVVPWLAPTTRMEADLHRYALPFPAINAAYDRTVVPWLAASVPGYDPNGVAFFYPEIVWVLELRVLPAIAMVGAIVGIALLRRGDLARGTRLLVAAAGVLAYAYYELLCYRVTGELLLGSLVHEVGELGFLVVTSELLVRLYPARA